MVCPGSRCHRTQVQLKHFLEDRFVPRTICALWLSLTCRPGCALGMFSWLHCWDCFAGLCFKKRWILNPVLRPDECRSLTGRNASAFLFRFIFFENVCLLRLIKYILYKPLPWTSVSPRTPVCETLVYNTRR